MKEKIDWYQEVLELEPGSKVFFPLARLLAENGDIEKCVRTLRHGLERHPEFIEARLYLIDLLHKHGQSDVCEAQIAQLAPLFSRYAGFWQAWGSSVAASGGQGDAGLALSFLAAVFSKGPLSLSDVISRGLASSLANTTNTSPEVSHAHAAPIAENSLPSVARDEQIRDVNSILYPLTDKSRSASGHSVSLPSGPLVAPEERASLATDTASVTPETPPATVATTEEEGDEEGEERFSVRTRSMAEVLAEQGDFAGALEIYQELVSVAASPEEAADLQYRISTLTAHLGAAQESVAEPVATTSPGKHRVLSVLEALAERLESRVHG